MKSDYIIFNCVIVNLMNLPYKINELVEVTQRHYGVQSVGEVPEPPRIEKKIGAFKGIDRDGMYIVVVVVSDQLSSELYYEPWDVESVTLIDDLISI